MYLLDNLHRLTDQKIQTQEQIYSTLSKLYKTIRNFEIRETFIFLCPQKGNTMLLLPPYARLGSKCQGTWKFLHNETIPVKVYYLCFMIIMSYKGTLIPLYIVYKKEICTVMKIYAKKQGKEAVNSELIL